MLGQTATENYRSRFPPLWLRKTVIKSLGARAMAFSVVSNELISSQTCAVLRLTTAFVLLLFFFTVSRIRLSNLANFSFLRVLPFAHSLRASLHLPEDSVSRERERERLSSGTVQTPSPPFLIAHSAGLLRRRGKERIHGTACSKTQQHQQQRGELLMEESGTRSRQPTFFAESPARGYGTLHVT